MSSRSFPLTAELFRRSVDVPAEQLTQVEGGRMSGLVTVKTLMATHGLVMLESFRARGVVDPEHAHDDHETVCYLLSGALRVVIGERTFDARPGDVWYHPPNVPHYAEALEDSVQLEVKVPPRKTWHSPDGSDD